MFSPVLVLSQLKQVFFNTEKTRMLVKGSLASFALRALGMLLRLGLGIALARLLGASSYGVYAYAITWLAFLAMPSIMGLDQVLVRYVSAYQEQGAWSNLKGLLRFSGALGLAAGVIVGVASLGIVGILSGMEKQLQLTLLATLVLLPVVVAAQMRQAALRGLGKPALALLPESLLYPIALLSLTYVMYLVVGSNITAPHVAVANVGAWVVVFGLGAVLLLLNVPEPVRRSVAAYEKSVWVKMVLPLIFIGLITHVVLRAEVLILGALSTSQNVGVYIAASRAAATIQFAEEAMMFAGAALFSRIYVSGDRKELQRFTILISRVILGITLPVYIVLMSAAPWILSLFGQEFVSGAGVMRLLTTTHFLGSVGGFVIIMLYMTGHPRAVAIVMSIAAVLNVGLSFLLIPNMGIMGASIASGTSLLLLKGSLVIVLYKKEGVLSLPFRLGI